MINNYPSNLEKKVKILNYFKNNNCKNNIAN